MRKWNTFLKRTAQLNYSRILQMGWNVWIIKLLGSYSRLVEVISEGAKLI